MPEVIVPKNEKHSAETRLHRLEKRAFTETSKKPEKEALKLEVIRSQVGQQARPAGEIAYEQTPEDPSRSGQSFVNKELKEMAYQRAINRIRRQLNPIDRLTSHFIHQPVINYLSDATARTVGRPWGILGGGFLAFCGSLIYYFFSKYYGYDYNFSVFLLLLVSGFIIGWAVEIGQRLLRVHKV